MHKKNKLSNRDLLIKQCHNFINSHLRAPAKADVLRWGKKLNLTPKAVLEISDNLKIRGQFGKFYINLILTSSFLCSCLIVAQKY